MGRAETCAGNCQDIVFVGELQRDRCGLDAFERMAQIRKERAGRHDLVAGTAGCLIRHRTGFRIGHRIGYRTAKLSELLGHSNTLGRDPIVEVIEGIADRELANSRGANGLAVRELDRLFQHVRCRGKRSDAVASEAERFRKTQELYQGLVPVAAREQFVRRVRRIAKVFVRFVQDQRDVVGSTQRVRTLDEIGWIRYAARIVGADKHERAGAVGDRSRDVIEIGKHAVGFEHISTYRLDSRGAQPHVVVEIKRRRQDHFIAWRTQCADGQTKGLVAPCCDHHVVDTDVAPIEVVCDRGARLGESERGCVSSGVGREHRGTEKFAEFVGTGISRNGLRNIDEGKGNIESAPSDPLLDERDWRVVHVGDDRADLKHG